MAGSAVVTTTIRLQGEDRASAEINKAKQAVDHTAKSLEEAASKSDTLTGGLQRAFSGDVLGAAKDLSGLMGGGAGLAGTLGMAALGAGAVAVAIAGVTIKASEWAMQLEKLRAATDHALGPNGLDNVQAMAAAAGGAAEDYGRLAGRLKLMGIDAHITAEQMAELGDRADDVGLDGKDAIQAFGDAIETGKTKALKAYGVFVDSEEAINRYAKAHNLSVTAMTEADKQTALLAAITENLDKKIAHVSDTASKADDSIDRMGNAWLRVKMGISGAVMPTLADLTDNVAETVDVTIRWGKVLVALMDVGMRPIITLIKVQIDAFVGLAAAADAVLHRDFAGAAQIARTVGKDIKTAIVDDNVDAMKRLGKAFDDALDPKKVRAPSDIKIKGDKANLGYEDDGPSPEILAKMRQERLNKAQRDRDAAHAKAVAAAKKHAEDVKKVAEQEAKNAEHWANERVKNEAADLAVLQRMQDESAKKTRDRDMKSAQDPAARAKLRLIELEAQRVKDLDKVRDSIFAKDRDRKATELAIERAANAERQQIYADLADESGKATAKQINDGLAVAEAMKGFLGEMGASKRVMAALDAALETARAIASYPDYVAMAQHGLAAAAYAYAAGSSAPSGSSGGSGSYAPAAMAPTASGSTSSGGSHVTHVHFSKGFVFGSPHEVAKGMSDTLKTLGGTGFATARGA